MQPLGVAADADWCAKERAETRLGDQLLARAVGDDAAVAHEDDALDFGQHVAEVMRDHNEAGAVACQAPEGFAEAALRGEVESVGGLVEQELARAMNECAGDQDAALFAGGHGADQLAGQMPRFDALQGFAGAHFIGDVQIGPERGGGKEAGDNRVEPGGDGGALAGKLATRGAGADHAEVAAQFGEVPALPAEDAHDHSRLEDGIELAGDGQNERGFAAAIGTEDGDVLAGADSEIDVVEHDTVAAGDADVAEAKEFRRTDLVSIHLETSQRPHLLD